MFLWKLRIFQDTFMNIKFKRKAFISNGYFITVRLINLMGPGVTLYSKPLYTMNELINKCKHI